MELDLVASLAQVVREEAGCFRLFRLEARDPTTTYASLQVIADEAWNYADGKRTVNQIAEAISAEFDFDLEPRHVLQLFQGLARQGYVSLES